MSTYPRSHHVTRGRLPVQSNLRTPGPPGLRANQPPNGASAQANAQGEQCRIVELQMKDRDQCGFCKALRFQICSSASRKLSMLQLLACTAFVAGAVSPGHSSRKRMACHSAAGNKGGTVKFTIQPGHEVLSSIDDSHEQHCTLLGLVRMRAITLHVCGIVPVMSLHASEVRGRSRLR